MNAVDRADGGVPLQDAWCAFGRRLAVLVGALVAFLSLLAEAPPSVASMRGAAAWLLLLAVTTAGAWVVPRVMRAPADESGSEDGDDPAAPSADEASAT